MALVPRFEPEMTDIAGRFIAHRVEHARAEGAVLGVSGGLDSTVVGALCARALGKKRVTGLVLPEADPPPESRIALDWLGIPDRTARMGPAVRELVRASPPGLDRGAVGNIKARVRMILLYAEANRKNLLVVGTGNKSELLTGYFTKHGDGGADLLPIGDLYKTQVRGMAEDLGVPARIRKLVPTAGLYPGQTDEKDLGIKYEKLDSVLLGLELRLDHGEISQKAQVPLPDVERVARRVQLSIHKRGFPPVCKMGIRTVGVDWREEMASPDEE